MKNKTPLLLIEQVVLLLVFVFAAAVCLRAFVWADIRAQENAERDRAMIEVQNAIEVAKAVRGDWMRAAAIYGGAGNAEGWSICYDDEWDPGPKNQPFVLRVTDSESGEPLLGLALVQLWKGEVLLLETEAAWQEVTP